MFRMYYFPNFMIIGVQKSGTSTLHFLPNQHPDLIGSDPKEIHYFDKPLKERNSLEWYKSHFSRSIFEKRKLFFETTPNYIYYSHIPAEIIDLNSSLKFIVMLRNPVERCFSAWNMYKNIFDEYKNGMPLIIDKDKPIFRYLFKDRAKFPTLEECLEIELNLMKQSQILEPALLRRGLYYDQLANYFRIFHPDRFLIVESNDFRSNVYKYLEQMAKFLNVSPFNTSKLNIQNKNIRKYDDVLQDNTRSFLKEFYREPNQKLYNLLNTQFDW
jgi:hypothetical protein